MPPAYLEVQHNTRVFRKVFENLNAGMKWDGKSCPTHFIPAFSNAKITGYFVCGTK